MRFELSEEKSFLWKMSSDVKYYKVSTTDELLNDQISTSLNFNFPGPFSLQQLSVLSKAIQRTKLKVMFWITKKDQFIVPLYVPSLLYEQISQKSLKILKDENSLSIVHSYHWGVKFSLPWIVSIGIQAAIAKKYFRTFDRI